MRKLPKHHQKTISRTVMEVVPSSLLDMKPYPTDTTSNLPDQSPNLCAYCNNPVPHGKFVHQACEDRHDEREEQADE